MVLNITALYGSVLGLLLVTLSWRVVRQRQQLLVGLGDAGHESLLQAQRVQANFVEYVPLALILLVLLEQRGTAAVIVHAFGASLMLGRVLHAWGLSHSSGRSFGRFYGTLLTWIVVLGLAVANLYGALAAG